MPLSIRHVRTGGAVAEGVIDIAAQYTDSKLASSASPFENVTDISRIAVTVGAGIASIKMKQSGKGASVAEGLFLASIPLTMKSATNLVLKLTGSATRFRAPNQPITSQRGQIMVRRPGTTYNPKSPTGITGTVY